MNQFFKNFSEFFISRRFSKVPHPFPNSEKYNDYLSAQKIEIVLNPGDMLFIPAGWFHFVISEKVDEKLKINTAISYFTKYDNKDCLDCTIYDSNYFKNCKMEIESVKILNYKEYKTKSQPFIIKDYFKFNKYWSLFDIAKKKLCKIFDTDRLRVTRSKQQLFCSNYIKRYFPDCCDEIKMTFDEFIKAGICKQDDYNYYLIQSELKNFILEIPHFISNEIYANYSLWINFGNIYSSLHYDIHNNILTQIHGTKRILLFPPTERSKLHLINENDPSFLCTLNKIVTR